MFITHCRYLYTNLKQLPGVGGQSIALGGIRSSYASGKRRSTGHNVRRMSGAANLLQHEGEGTGTPGTPGTPGSHPKGHRGSLPSNLEKLPEEPSSTSLRSRKSF